ncbi:SRPBCC domain-containing protein [Kineosporia sp. A_224]|uniref:SRPBCC domain-containing protein n=1 Tax=Kineosporia sp. A_224 TaxID=1962180 RepID=UPI000B4B9A09|nr:SRPBCC domain-containing protein [Kineosporia sp. A_224]
MQSTRTSRVVAAPPAAVYRALLDPGAVAAWRVPEGMTSVVHLFEAREGGAFRVSLTYEAPDGRGKSHDRTDTYAGRFVRLVPDALVVEELAFESPDPAMSTPMTMTTTLATTDGGTLVTVVHEGLPDAVPAADNELGTRMALDNLARLVETRP